MAKKLTIEEVKKRAKDIGVCEVLDDVYINSKTKLNCRCIEKGHHYRAAWAHIRRGDTCPHCNNRRLTINDVRIVASKINWTILTNHYSNNEQRLDAICPMEHRCKTTWEALRLGGRCSQCASDAQRFTIDYVKMKAKEVGWTVLDDYYNNCSTKLNCVCSEGHKHRISWSNLRQGRGCPICFNESRKFTLEIVKKKAKQLGIWEVTDTTYVGAAVKLKCKCLAKGHYHEVCWDGIKQGYGCPKCNKSGKSKWEKSVKSFLVESDISYISNDRTQLINPNTNRNLELDIWFPQLGKAIECNGIYWHGKKRAIKNDKIKQQLCKNQGIDLLVVTDKEWGDDIDKCKAKIKNFVTGE